MSYSGQDYVVNYDPKNDNQLAVAARILNSLFIKRVKANKPVIWFVGGDSGNGKSYSTLWLQEILLGLQGLNVDDYLEDINIFTPLEYTTKMDAILNDKRLKKVNVVVIHEARDLVRSSNWNNFLSQTVSDVNTQSRQLKPLIIIIISQFIRDVTTDVRYSLTHYSTVSRPNSRTAPSTIRLQKIWKDDRDLEKPKIRRSLFKGFLRLPNGRYQRHVLTGLQLKKPRQELCDRFDALDTEAKRSITQRKFKKLFIEMQKELGIEDATKIDTMVDQFSSNLESIHLLGKRSRGKWRISDQGKKMFDLDKEETIEFERKFTEKLQELGVLDNS